jgi:hypothetical protein
VQQVSAANKKLEADLANLQVNPKFTCFTRTKVQKKLLVQNSTNSAAHQKLEKLISLACR